jgi:hypothetical protein
MNPGLVQLSNAPALTNAVRKIGAKGIPILLKKLQARDSWWRKTMDNTWGRKFFSERWFDQADHDRNEAVQGFFILGSDAAPAIPELSKMLLDTNDNGVCSFVLGVIGPRAFPVLTAALTNQNETIRLRALTGLQMTTEGTRLAIPVALAMRSRTNDWPTGAIFVRAASMLPEDEALQLVSEFARVPRWQTNQVILLALENLRTNTAPALPLLEPFLTNSSFLLRLHATNILVRWSHTAVGTWHFATNSPQVSPLKN